METQPTKVPASDVRVGDVIHFLGSDHRVTELTEMRVCPGTGCNVRSAKAADGWGITLFVEDPFPSVEVWR